MTTKGNMAQAMTQQQFDREMARAQDHINQLEAANKELAEYKNSIERLEKWKAWALDRAIASVERSPFPAADVITLLADKFFLYTYNLKDEELKNVAQFPRIGTNAS